MTESGLPDCSAINGHEWRTIQVDAAGHGSLVTHVYEECGHCKLIRLNPEREHDVYVMDRTTGEYGQI